MGCGPARSILSAPMAENATMLSNCEPYSRGSQEIQET